LQIQQILDSLGLLDRSDEYSKNLSGGEQKRLSIALELVDDPQIIFLDEPTTGLDSSSSTQCLSLLKKLAKDGKTIICTIHQPTALQFLMFDHLYVLADGCCIYQGSSGKVVPFLADLDLKCPAFYSPADYLLEIATNDYGPQNDRLTKLIENGISTQYSLPFDSIDEQEDLQLIAPESTASGNYSTTFGDQLYHLVIRNFLINSRDKTLILMRLSINLLVGLCFGTIYYGIGSDASHIFDIQKYLVYSIYHPMFISFNSQLTTSK